MLKQSPSRSQKSKGSRAKQALQICLVLAICIWLINQSKQLYDGNKMALETGSKKVSQKGKNGYQMLRLARKNLNPQLDELVAEFEKHQDEELELEDEESKLRENDEDESGGDQEKTEEGEHEQLEDLIDEDDKEE